MSESRSRGSGNRRAVGRQAEDQAAEFLRGLGFTIVTRNYTVKGGELDLVAVDGDELVFIEVRQRRGAVGAPEESLGPKKAGRLRVAARAYLAEIGEPERTFRFDVVAIDEAGLRHHRGAFGE